MRQNKIDEYHPEYSSRCMRLGCSYCKINRNVAENIFNFIKEKRKSNKNNLLANHWRVKVQKELSC